jgi:S1-C subfamily serine protease
MNMLSVKRARAAALALTLGLAAVQAQSAEPEKKEEESRAEMEQKLEAAQKRLDAAAREVADLSMSLSDHFVPHMRAFAGARMQRAMLGVNLGRRDEKGPDDGVQIASVSPGGAAEKAGLRADDVLLEINGKSLKREGEDSPREKLLAAMREVKPGEKVSVRYRRAGKASTVSVVAEEPADRMFVRRFGPGPEMGHVEHMPFMAFGRGAGVFGSAELVSLTPKLGQYFGTEKGLLVVRAPDDASLKLEDGDVILDIDGRTPKSASHALRILHSYQAGEKLKLNVLRARKPMTFDVTVPESAWEKPLGMLRQHFIDGVPAAPAAPAIMRAPFEAAIPVPPPGAPLIIETLDEPV